MSCQVFSRDIEHGILAWVFDQMKQKNCEHLRAYFRPTAKNEYLRRFLTFYSDKKIPEESNNVEEPFYLPLKRNQDHSFMGSLCSSVETF